MESLAGGAVDAGGALAGTAGAVPTWAILKPADSMAAATSVSGCPTKLGITNDSGSGSAAISTFNLGDCTPTAFGGGLCAMI